MTWRGWLGFCAAGVALASGYRHDWALAGVAAVVALVPVIWWVRGQLLATRAMMCGEMVPGRHRRRGRPRELRQVPAMLD